MTSFFDLSATPVETGVTFVEASAGTGKTYAIAGLVVRLILERSLPIQQILVVTYTEAATDELRGRVRARIAGALRALEENRDDGDPALTVFAAAADTGERLQGVKRLRLALLFFDEAAIFTIHGFCQRTLRENAFETGSPFDAELLTDSLPLWKQCVEDFHRGQTSGADEAAAVVLACLRADGTLSEKTLLDLLAQLTRHPDLVILRDHDPEEEQAAARVRELLEALAAAWARSGEEITALLNEHPGLSRAMNAFSKERTAEIITELECWRAEGGITPHTLRMLLRLATENVNANTKGRAKEKPAHPFFDLCQKLLDTTHAIGRNYRREFIQYARGGLEALKREKNLLTFDDLLTRMADGLDGPGGTDLAKAIGRVYGAALIDEFQDTDPVQWRIFRGIFAGGNYVLFLIGDPKQAIYGFRGADIFTYLEAKRVAWQTHTLSKNWRTDQPLVEGVNSLFQQNAHPFVFEGIAHQPAVAARAEVGFRGAEGSPDEKPLRLVPVVPEDGGALTVAESADRILKLVTSEISALLQSGCRIPDPNTGGERPVEPGDIAVLVRKNREAVAARTALGNIGLPAVIRTDESVLQTPEAAHLLTWMEAVMEPGRNGLVKAALATPLFGYDAAVLDRLDSDEGAWQKAAEPFFHWREIWFRHGFIRMFRSFGHDQGIRVRLLAHPDGERALTNVQHAAECLHRAGHDLSLNPAALARWLREQRAKDRPGDDSHLIRLEKDEQAVQIVTIHRSKGLEYPVVFVPFNWTNAVSKNADPVFHDPDNHNRLTWDMRRQPSEESLRAFQREQLAESLRLLYVAVTRARNRCYLYWAATRDSVQSAKSPLAWLHGGGEDSCPPPDEAFRGLSGQPGAGLHSIDPTGRSGVFPRGTPDGGEPRARPFTRQLPGDNLITSFSALTAAGPSGEADRDPHTPVPTEEESGESRAPTIFTFPKGVRAGNFFHALLENLDFTDPRNLGRLTEEGLLAHGIDPVHAPVVVETIRALLDFPLPDGPKLGELAAADRRPEIPFTYPVRRVVPAELRQVTGSFEGGLRDSLDRLVYSPREGYLTGFIDLVFRHNGKFHLADWKSNWLGPTGEDYQTEALQRAMDAGRYHLQYHLYALALHRHLRQTVPGYRYEKHFGGIYYLFLRGVDRNHPGRGVFHARPAADLIHRLETLLFNPADREEKR